MKSLLAITSTFVFLALSSFPLLSQSTVTYTYDSSGNRIKRQTSAESGQLSAAKASNRNTTSLSSAKSSTNSKEGGATASFTYNDSHDRVGMVVTDSTGAPLLNRTYLGGRYERDVTPSDTTERFWLGEDAYSAPAVLVRSSGGGWTFYNIGRDCLGSVTHVLSSDGDVVAEYSYDPLKYSDPDGEFAIAALLLSAGIGAIVNVALNAKKIDNFWEGLAVASVGAGTGIIASLTGGSSLGIQAAIGLGVGITNSATSNIVDQLGNSGNGNFDWGKFGRASISGAVTGAVTAGANKLINTGKVSNFVLDKLKVKNNLERNVLGNAIEGATTGIVAGTANGTGSIFTDNKFENWSWKGMAASIGLGLALGAGIGAINGAITEGIYQQQLKKGYGSLRNSEVAGALGERAGDISAYLESSVANMPKMPGHNYGQYVYEINLALPNSICIDIATGRCTITIDPSMPMVPTQPTYYAP